MRNADTPKALPAHDISLASDEPFLALLFSLVRAALAALTALDCAAGRRRQGASSAPPRACFGAFPVPSDSMCAFGTAAKLFELDANSVGDMACTPESFLLDPALAPSPAASPSGGTPTEHGRQSLHCPRRPDAMGSPKRRNSGATCTVHMSPDEREEWHCRCPWRFESSNQATLPQCQGAIIYDRSTQSSP